MEMTNNILRDVYSLIDPMLLARCVEVSIPEFVKIKNISKEDIIFLNEQIDSIGYDKHMLQITEQYEILQENLDKKSSIPKSYVKLLLNLDYRISVFQNIIEPFFIIEPLILLYPDIEKSMDIIQNTRDILITEREKEFNRVYNITYDQLYKHVLGIEEFYFESGDINGS